jgi:uncharacterized metal-binding protein YceD (DUF177 family)
VKKGDSYIVRISGLGEGEHDFSFKLGRDFFTSFDQTEIEHGEVNAAVILKKSAGSMVLYFHLKGEVEVVCDRCLDRFMIPIRSDQQLILKRGEKPGEIEDDVVVIGMEEHEIDVRQYLYEFLMLSLPCRRVHPPDENGLSGCNPKMIEKLESHQDREDSPNGETDPRWDALKEIIEKNN